MHHHAQQLLSSNWIYRSARWFLLILICSLTSAIPHVVSYANGSAALIKDINPNGASVPSSFLVMGDILFFTADDGVYGRELWRSDGTTAGTVMVLDINTCGQYAVLYG